MLLVWQVVVDDDSHVPAKIEYQAESPDEKALVEAARDFGMSHHALLHGQRRGSSPLTHSWSTTEKEPCLCCRTLLLTIASAAMCVCDVSQGTSLGVATRLG